VGDNVSFLSARQLLLGCCDDNASWAMSFPEAAGGLRLPRIGESNFPI
jgi:hypothetical protein